MSDVVGQPLAYLVLSLGVDLTFISYTTSYHTSFAGFNREVCTALSALVKLILREISAFHPLQSEILLFLNFHNNIQSFSGQMLWKWILKTKIFTTDTGKLKS